MPFALYVLFGLVVSQPAYAYLDPGAASLALQALVGGLAAAGVAVVAFAARVKAFFRRILGLSWSRGGSGPRV